MPSFTIRNPSMRRKGLFSEVSVNICNALEEVLIAQHKAVPDAIAGEAKIDTGADRSVIGNLFVSKLGLKPASLSFVDTPSTKNVPCYEYAVKLAFPNDVTWQGLMLEFPGEKSDHDILIGRDILGHGVLNYIGYDNSFSLSF